MISRETERFVNEIHDHKEELRSSDELLTAERGSNSSKEACASPPVILLVILCSRKRLFLEVNENGLRLMLTLHQGAVCLQRYPRWSRRWFVITIKMNVKKTDPDEEKPHDDYTVPQKVHYRNTIKMKKIC